MYTQSILTSMYPNIYTEELFTDFIFIFFIFFYQFQCSSNSSSTEIKEVQLQVTQLNVKFTVQVTQLNVKFTVQVPVRAPFCSEATQFKVFVRAPDSLNNCRKKYIYVCIMTPLSAFQIKDSPEQIRNPELFQFILAYN